MASMGLLRGPSKRDFPTRQASAGLKVFFFVGDDEPIALEEKPELGAVPTLAQFLVGLVSPSKKIFEPYGRPSEEKRARKTHFERSFRGEGG